MPVNKLHFGDNLDVLREQIKDESVDLIYLDPPFNSNATYNVLFKDGGQPSAAQAEAFRDTWGWGDAAAAAYDDVLRGGDNLASLMRALRSSFGESPMTAYLAMMAARLRELWRVLKPTGSLYLHCDPTASHYLKIVLDGVFGPDNYRNEISWKRQSAHNDTKQGRAQYGNVRDVILFYTKSKAWCWNPLYTPYDEEYVRDFYRHVDPDSGRRYRLSDLTAPGGASPEKRNPHYEFLGVTRYWRYSKENMEKLHAQGRIVQSAPGRVPSFKRYLDEMPGVALQNDWSDIRPTPRSESLGYPTQKPLALLERIVSASSKEGDVILDPFCGCGTSVEAAQKLKRHWIGIDVTHYAITLIEQRLQKYGSVPFKVEGRPTDLEGAKALARRDKYQFQWWASWLLGAQTYESKKGADRGIDGNIYFPNGPHGYGRIIVSVKGGDHIAPSMVRELYGVVERESAEMGVLVTLQEPTRSMLSDAAASGFVGRSAHGRLPRIQIVTVGDLLDGKAPRMPPVPVPEPVVTTRQKAVSRKAKNPDQLEILLPFQGAGIKTKEGAFVDPRHLSNVSAARR